MFFGIIFVEFVVKVKYIINVWSCIISSSIILPYRIDKTKYSIATIKVINPYIQFIRVFVVGILCTSCSQDPCELSDSPSKHWSQSDS